jgi:hypothetical protein
MGNDTPSFFSRAKHALKDASQSFRQSTVGAAVVGAVQTGFGGFGEKLAAFKYSLLDGTPYTENLEKIQRHEEASAAAHPDAHVIGEVGGVAVAAATAGATGGALGAASGAKDVVEAGKFAAKVTKTFGPATEVKEGARVARVLRNTGHETDGLVSHVMDLGVRAGAISTRETALAGRAAELKTVTGTVAGGIAGAGGSAYEAQQAPRETRSSRRPMQNRNHNLAPPLPPETPTTTPGPNAGQQAAATARQKSAFKPT